MTRNEFKKKIVERIAKYPEGAYWINIARHLVDDEDFEFSDQLDQIFSEIEKEGLVFRKNEKYFVTS